MTLAALLVLTMIAPPTGWEHVQSIPAGTSIRVETDHTSEIRGRFVEATDMALTITVSDQRVTLPVDAVRQVVRVQRRTAVLARRGFLIGAIAGAGWAAALAESNRQVFVPMLAAGWGAIGSLIGALEGRRSEEVKVVYRRP